jgi:hypothetical protein
MIVVTSRLTEAWDLVRPMIVTEFAPSHIQIPLQPARLAPEPLFLQGALSLALRRLFAQPSLGW